jgi:hypothetical protein
VLLGGLAAAACGCGCGGPGSTVTPAALALERQDLVAVSRTLSAAEPSLATEVAATKAAWPLVVNGLPADTAAIPPAAIHAAAQRAAALRVPALFQEQQSASLTGPGSSLASAFRNSSTLAARAWQLIGAAIAEIQHGSPAAARFARANVAVYIESVYDAHFSLAQIGKQLLAGYRKLGGSAAFGASLTQAEVDRLANAYSQANDRLHPHTGVQLGS